MADQHNPSAGKLAPEVIKKDLSITTMMSLKRKRQCDKGSVNCPKMLKPEISTKIVDLNGYCLEHIFSYLSLDELLAVVNLSPESEYAAKTVFSRRYSKYLVKFCGYKMDDKLIDIDEDSLEIRISSASICVQILRWFGVVIKKLELFNFVEPNMNNEWSDVKLLIDEKCCGNLHELKLTNVKCDLMNDIEKKFLNVEKLSICCSRLAKCVDLNQWFPKLYELKLFHHDRCIQTVNHFPFLNYLTMDIDDICLSTTNFKAMLQSTATTLTKLSLSGGMKTDLLQFVCDTLPDLKDLELIDFTLDDDTDKFIVFKNVQKVIISMGLLETLPSNIPLIFIGLTELQVFRYDSIGTQWIDFAMKHSELTKLILETDEFEVTDDHLDELAMTLNQLIEFNIYGNISVNGIGHFLAHSKTLQKLRIETSNRKNDYSLLRVSNDKKWKIKCEKRIWTFQRRSK